jgi:DNA polymerase-3 subunit beta
MKVIVNRSEIFNSLSLANAVIAARTHNPVLLNVLLSAENDVLTVYATDLEVSVRSTVAQVQIESTGSVLVPAKTLCDIIRESIGDTVSLATSGDTINITDSDSNFKLFTGKASDYPAEPADVKASTFSVSLAEAKKLLSRTNCAVSDVDNTRFAFNGTMFKAKGKTLEMVATDGRRLAHASCDLLEAFGETSSSALVPRKAMALVSKLEVAKGDEPTVLSVTISDSRIVFACDGVRIGSALIEGSFPPYEDIVPKGCDKKMITGREDFLCAVRRASLLTTDESKGVRFAFSKNGLHMSSQDPSAGEANVTHTCKFQGSSIEIGFNPKYLLDGLKSAGDDEVTLELSEPNRPGLLRSERFFYIAMPIALEKK